MFKIFEILSGLFPNINFHIITGIGYLYKDELKSDENKRIYVHNDIQLISEYMENADLAITSQGRTIYELAYMGIPSIVLAQNMRETTHVFANLKNGFINMGISTESDNETIINTIAWLINTPNVRKEMHNTLLNKDLASGQNRVLKIILGEK